MTEAITGIVALVAGVLIGWLLQQVRQGGGIQSLQDRLNDRESSLREQSDLLSMERRMRSQAQAELAAERERSNNLQVRMAEHKRELDELQQRFTKEFKLVADQLLEEKSRRFSEQNKEQLGELLNPLRERIKEFEQKVEHSNKEHLERNTALKTEIQQLKELNQAITQEAANLTEALKGSSKEQGDWGEVILERILEKSGLTRGREYEVQPVYDSEEGKQRPDVVVQLPGDRCIIIDSKVSLTDYERYHSASDPQEQEEALKKHIQSLRRHVQQLSDKRYQDLEGKSHLEFVLLFVPVEPAFYLATREDRNLYHDALQKNIVIVSTSTLIATLMMINTLWRREDQNQNARKIAAESGKLYDKFVTFVSHLEKLGKQLRSANDAYLQVHNTLVSGRGNLLSKAERIRNLGAANSKHLPEHLQHDQKTLSEDLSLPDDTTKPDEEA